MAYTIKECASYNTLEEAIKALAKEEFSTVEQVEFVFDCLRSRHSSGLGDETIILYTQQWLELIRWGTLDLAETNVVNKLGEFDAQRAKNIFGITIRKSKSGDYYKIDPGLHKKIKNHWLLQNKPTTS